MAGFKKDVFEKKLTGLNESQQIIQTVSLWVIHHRKHYKEIVQVWLDILKKEPRSKNLTFLYVANDVIQNSRKKLPQFAKEFLKALPSALEHISKDVEDKVKNKIERVITIWEERGIYEKKDIKNFQSILAKSRVKNGSSKSSRESKPTTTTTTPAKETLKESSSSENRKRKSEESKPSGATASKKKLIDDLDSKTIKTMLQKIVKSAAMELPLASVDAAEKVDSEKLIKSLKELETCPSADEVLRKKIANFPSEVFDVGLIETAIAKDGGNHDKWLKVVDEAQETLKNYNKKLAQEIEDRTNSFSMLVNFLAKQKDELGDIEKSLGDTKEKLRKCDSVREELKSHIASLPDLSQLPQVALPSALDLFNKPHDR